MEIAICSDCHEKLKNGYSEESRNAIWNFYLDHADLANREQRFATLPADDPSPWIASCATCGTPRHDAEDYTIGAECRGRQLVYGINPMMICGSCLEQIFNRLSQASRDNYNRWFDRCFPPDPTASNDTPSRNLLV